MANEYMVNASDVLSIANAIREKGGTTEGLAFPDGFISSIQLIQSGSGLNFTVIGGTTQPKNPEENTVWVNTDVEIGKWIVSVSEPEAPSVGDIWMQHCIEGFELDVIDENNLIVSITYVKQYSDSGWLVKEWEVYKNNMWIKYETDLYLYNLENGCLVEFGGMQDDASQVTVTNEQLRVYSYGAYNQNTDFLIYTVNPIDLTPYSTLELIINCDGTTQFKDYSYFGFATSINTGSYGQTYSASTKYSAVTSGDNTLTLDISNLSGNYYFATGGYGMTFTVKKICLGR